jgi:hypothetical protein
MVLNLDFLTSNLGHETRCGCLNLQIFRASRITQQDRTVIAKISER